MMRIARGVRAGVRASADVAVKPAAALAGEERIANQHVV
jgi:hypothetical protein